ncbi:MAG: 16S rRNA (cytosine(1402)-N(4))-methyltransferase RsmH [Candidatus Binatia bacterium]|nr:16S rRNA (cytosine(1402)-N(4))-methyltransferase RsmH [Candidatus Binatia bacterium]
MDGLEHEPVMRADVVRLLLPTPRPGLRLIDLTVGLGGHSEALLEAAPSDAELLAIDRDPVALEKARARLAPFGDRVHLVQSPFSGMPGAMDSIGWTHADGILADLGVSSMQLDDAGRGFSFQSDAPLDMRMDQTHGESAAELLARLDVSELGTLIKELGDEPAGRRIARAIKRADESPATTSALRAAVHRAVGPRRGRKHDPSTLTFQALRIAVNRELEELDALLVALQDRLSLHGRVVILAYHSLEDRPVKRTFALWAKACVCPPALMMCQCGGKARAEALTRRVATPSEEEIEGNPRARSARLRAIEWLEDAGDDS